MKKCKEGHYYCYQDSKCKPIPKGYRRGVGGYLRREREDEQEDSKKNGNGKSNGSSNGNGNGGNGSGNGNGSSGGNGGGNGSGGIGENVEIQNSDGETTAIVVDIIGPANMKPMVNNSGVWKGTQIDEKKKLSGNAIFPFKANVKIKNEIISDDGISTKNPVKKVKGLEKFDEAKMTEDEKEKKEDIVKGMKKDKKGFKKRYGKDAESVMYATATKLAMEEKHKDHEPEMIRNQLKTAKRASKRIKSHTLKKDNFKAWVQSKITKASDYLDTAADYLDSKDDMKEELDKKDKPYIKKLVKNLRKGSKTHAKQADKLEKAMNEESNPRIPRKKGQPANSKKHSDLYTDENPKGTIHGLGFKDVATAKASVSKIRNSSRSHAHKIQAAVAMEQRAREMGKTSEAAVYRKFINSMKKKTKK